MTGLIGSACRRLPEIGQAATNISAEATRSCEMEILAIECAQFGIQQLERLVT